MHKGIDLAAPTGTEVVATSDGIVVNTDYKPEGPGRYITIKHDDSYTTFYSQLDEVLVKLNQKIKKVS